MYIPDNQSLKLIEIANAGIPNLEYITLFAAENINLAQYGLIIGYRPFEIATPLTNFYFWLSEVNVDKGTWIFVFTGSGTSRFTKTTTNEPAYLMYWGNKNVLFNDANVVPILFQMGAAEIGKSRGINNLLPSQN